MKVNTNYMRNIILKLCKENPKLANDDLALMAAIWSREGWYAELTLTQNLKRVSHPETIRRTRQKLQAECLLTPTEETTDHRYEDYKEAREVL